MLSGPFYYFNVIFVNVIQMYVCKYAFGFGRNRHVFKVQNKNKNLKTVKPDPEEALS